MIRAFDAEHPRMTLTELAARTDLTRATARRFLLTLADLGYVATDGKLFSLTPRVLELGFSYLSGLSLPEMRVDGGATRDDLLMQIQADLLGVPLARPAVTETTALGAAYLAGLAVGFWKNAAEIAQQQRIEKRFTPQMSQMDAEKRRSRWKEAVERAKHWAKQQQIEFQTRPPLNEWTQAELDWNQSQIQDWSFDTLPQKIEIAAMHGLPLYGYPGLIKDDEGLHRQLFHDEAEARIKCVFIRCEQSRIGLFKILHGNEAVVFEGLHRVVEEACICERRIVGERGIECI